MNWVRYSDFHLLSKNVSFAKINHIKLHGVSTGFHRLNTSTLDFSAILVRKEKDKSMILIPVIVIRLKKASSLTFKASVHADVNIS